MKIKNISTRKILNSAAKWTIETKVELEDGSIGVGSVPGGLSKGINEVDYINPNDAEAKLAEISNELTSQDFESQEALDRYLINKDGTEKKLNLGGNIILSTSIAFCKATAMSKDMETYEYIRSLVDASNTEYKMPSMMMLILEGGVHGLGSSTVQEFMAIVESVPRGMEIYQSVKDELHSLNKSTNVGAEGAFSPVGYDNDQMLSLLSGFLHGEKIALDVAASSFPEGATIPNYEELIKNYPISSIEDPYEETDWTNWELFGQKYGSQIMIVTDDLTTTNPKILKEAIEKDVGNAILVKPNQIGSVSETLEVMSMAVKSGWQTVVSHRGTDTNDDFIADLAIGANADYVKFGAPARGERVAKYNRLLEIITVPSL